MRVFVTGGSGFIGGHLIERLSSQGHEVYALARSSRAAKLVEGYGAIPVEGDLLAVEGLIPPGVEVVVHSAARAEDWGTREQFWSVNVEGTRAALAAAQQAAVRRFLFVGTEAVLFTGNGLLNVDETTPYPDRHRYLYSETKAVSEQEVLACNRVGHFETLSIRPRFVWGPRDTSVLPVLLRMHSAGTFAWIDGGRSLSSTTHVYNVVHALELALTRGNGGQAYFVVDDGVRTIREFLSALVWAGGGVDLGRKSLPSWLARPVARIVERIWSWLPVKGPPPMSALAVDMAGCSVTVNDQLARRDLGYQPVISVEEGLRALESGALTDPGSAPQAT